MAVGDVIADNGLGVAAYVYFQPAATIEIMITAGIGQGNYQYYGNTDGIATDSVTSIGKDGAYANNLNCKLGITNTHYLAMYSAAASAGYSGIQIK